MTAVSSHVGKTNRAEQHLADLKDAIGGYGSRHPYTVRTRRESKKKPQVRRLDFTEQPDMAVALIAADFIYNIRSGLDHLAAALVPSKDRDSVMFPIFFRGVWEPPQPGDDKERLKHRQRWITITRHMADEAVAILRAIQPEDVTSSKSEAVHGLVAINRLSNTDRHSKLPVLAGGLQDAVATWQMPDGTSHSAAAGLGARRFLKQDAEIRVPQNAMNVQIAGTPIVVIRVTHPNDRIHIRVPEFFEGYLKRTRSLMDDLAPYLRRRH